MKPFKNFWLFCLVCLAVSNAAFGEEGENEVGQELPRLALKIGMPEFNPTTNITLTPTTTVMLNQILHDIPAFKLGLLKTFKGILSPILHFLLILAILLFAVAGTTAFVCSLTDCLEGRPSKYPHFRHPHGKYPYFKKSDNNVYPPSHMLHIFSKALEDTSEKYGDLNSNALYSGMERN